MVYLNINLYKEFHMEQVVNVSEQQKQLELLKKISWIKSWNILEQEKRFLIEKMLTVSNYYFPNITTLETKRGAKDTNHILKKIDDYKYEAIHTEREADQIERRTLRKIKSLEKHTT